MEEEKKEVSTNNKSILIIGIVIGMAVMGLVGLLAWNLGVQFVNSEDKANKPETKEEVVEVNVEEMNKQLEKFHDAIFNQFDHKYGNKLYLDGKENGANLLDTNEKKLFFAVFKSDKVLSSGYACEKLGMKDKCGMEYGTRAILLEDLKESYKNTFGEEMDTLPACQKGDDWLEDFCTINGYAKIIGSADDIQPAKQSFSFNSLTKNGYYYTLTIDIKDLKITQDYPLEYEYELSGKQIIIKSVKDSNNNYIVQSMTYKK